MNATPAESLESFVRGITERAGFAACLVTVTSEGEGPVSVAIATESDANLLIGKNGTTLKALEQVVRVAWTRLSGAGRNVIVDVNDYRKEQLAKLVEQVHDAARRVRDTGKSEAMAPMSSYERRVVHTELASYGGLSSESIGAEPQRRVVIKPL
jgi:spoIIIJ-associated protein